ncbi:MAG: pirin family protein [Nevskiaceae bacterium]|nr:MAG: pirin family protein [Nevskiaceae bacterium]TBR72025.1 MAG: pirin family protein [Nevskiaceae bacterium]
MTERKLVQVVDALETSDGAGVKLRRSLGGRPGLRLDPFLMLDEFGTENPDDYIAGFPPHPHRGFTTVTYMLDGHMQHRDHLGNVGDLGPGGVQWMDAAHGVIHSEMPQQDHGRMRGMQLWLNLPAVEKMKPAFYRDLAPQQIPVVALEGGGEVKVIAGTAMVDEKSVTGPINTADRPVATDPLYLDIALPGGGVFTHPITAGHNAFIYVLEGGVRIGPDHQRLGLHGAGILGREGERATIAAEGGAARFLLLAARPLGEPVVQYGPFVMNTRDEVEQAMRDYQAGTLTAEPAPQS